MSPGRRDTRRQRLAGRLLDEHGDHLSSLAGLLTTNADRSDRLVSDAISGHVRALAPWRSGRSRGVVTLGLLAGQVHHRWSTTHAPRSSAPHGPVTLRSQLQQLSDTQLAVLALCLFGGYTYATAATRLGLTPLDAAVLLREALVAVAS